MSPMDKKLPQSNLRQVCSGEGELFDVAGVKFLWKARGEDTQFAFTIAEQTLLSGDGVPPHSHPYTEFFYVLEGEVIFRQIGPVDETVRPDETEFRCAAGDAVVVPANTIHTFGNNDAAPAQILGVSNHLHQKFFDGVQDADAAEPFAAMPPGEAMARIAQIGAAYSMIFAPPGD